ncbi:MAG: methyltransferase domain-containing protein [Acidobacteriota bacterium]|nr:methyltransferase domain-containing protein [Acidobacteriota bacterium]
MKWDTNLYDQKHSFVTKYGEDLLSLLDARPGERILDVGCGSGHLTKQIADTGAEVVGLDSSPEMIATAQAAYPTLKFLVADASDFSFDQPFDAIFSNAALHWVARAEEAVICMARALKPGGRFVIEMGGKGNIAGIATALEQAIRNQHGREVKATNYFPAIGEYAALLEKHGIEVVSALLFDRPTKLEGGEDGLQNWIKMFRRELVIGYSEAEQQAIFAEVKTALRNRLFYDGNWFADYRRLRITAYKTNR